ncbi:ribonuclease H-like domain-containing protein [Tanacetum coccineum]
MCLHLQDHQLLTPFTSTNVEDGPLGGSFHASLPRSTQASSAGHTLGGAEDPITLIALSFVVSTLVQKVNSLETELKAHKKLFKNAVGKLVKQVKEMEVKLKIKKSKVVVSNSDKEDGGEQDVDLDALHALANATVTVDSTKSPGGASIHPTACSYDHTSDVPTTDVPTDVPSGVAPPGPSTVSPGSTTVPTSSSVPAAETIYARKSLSQITLSHKQYFSGLARSLFLLLDQTRFLLVGQNQFLLVGQNQSLLVGQNQFLLVGQNQFLLVSKIGFLQFMLLEEILLQLQGQPPFHDDLDTGDGWETAVKLSQVVLGNTKKMVYTGCEDEGIFDSGCSRKLQHFKLVSISPIVVVDKKNRVYSQTDGFELSKDFKLLDEPLQLLHMDLFGPTSIRSIDHKYYYLMITDDYSRKPIEQKGIKRDYSNARTPQQNKVAERKNRTPIA